jgi:putative spermidine/putrescine transport system ATP-binding protein
MRGELRNIQAEFGITFIHVTHTQMEAIALADMVVVMDQGQIEQAGSAREVYDRPRTSYVAHFMGGQNVLAGTVIARQPGIITMTSGKKTIKVTAPASGSAPAPVEGEQFEVAVRRDRVRLSRAQSEDAEAGLNAASGRVSAIEYQGTWLKISVDGAGSEGFVANVPDDEFFADPLAIGDPVIARWDAEQLHYLVGRSARAPRAETGHSTAVPAG